MILSAYLKTVFELLNFQKRSFFKDVRGKSATTPQSERASEHTCIIMLLILKARYVIAHGELSFPAAYDVSGDRTNGRRVTERPHCRRLTAHGRRDRTQNARRGLTRRASNVTLSRNALSCRSAQTMRISPTRESANTTIMMIRFMRALRASGDD